MYLERVCATMHILFYFSAKKNICYYEKKTIFKERCEMENKTTKRKLKNFWERNKGKIVAAGAIATGVAATVIMSALNNETNGSEENDVKLLEDNNKTFDAGRDCLMTFTVEETGEVLGTIPVAESFVEDWKDLIPEINEHDYNK